MKEDGDFVLMVGGDLVATDRVLRAAEAAGLGFAKTSPGELERHLTERPPTLIVVDLDGGREAAVQAIAGARESGLLPGRVIGFFSHVDAALAEAARAAGLQAMPRGRFWQSLGSLFATGPG